MQIGTCLSTSFPCPSSKSGGGANEKRTGPEVGGKEGNEGNEGVRRKPVSCLLEHARFAI